MSLTDQARLSPKRGWGTFVNGSATPTSASPASIAACNEISSILATAGWKLVGSVYATTALSGPFGWGYISFLRQVCVIGNAAYQFYDPTFEAAPHGKVGDAWIVPVPIGANSAGSQENLCSQISGSGAFLAIPTDATTILLIATAPGTFGDGIVVTGQGSISIGGVSSGGGWILESQPQAINTAVIRLQVSTGAPGSGGIQFQITILGTVLTYYLALGTWYLAASSWQACFYNLDPYGADLYAYNKFLWACCPVIDDRLASVLTSCAFVAQPGNLPASSTLGASGPGAGMNVVDMWVAGSHTTGAPGQRGWSVVMDHSQGKAIVDPIAGAVFQPAMVSMYTPLVGESRIVGYLPDCVASSVPAYGIGQQIEQEGYHWRAIATQDSPPGCLWMATAEQVGEPAPPPPEPQYAKGAANVWGPEVHRVSGDVFDASMAGKTITINGTPYTISEVIDSDDCTIAPNSSPPLTAALYSIQL